jgi:streptogramin lyase
MTTVNVFPITSDGPGLVVFPGPLTPGPDGNLWFPLSSGKIGRITSAGAITSFPLPTLQGIAEPLTAAPDGNLWFPEATGKIGRITPAGDITEFPTPETSSVSALTAGSDGNLWFFTQRSPGSIGRIAPSGVVTEFPIPSSLGSGGTSQLTVGPDGNLWFSAGSDQIGRISPSGGYTAFPIASPSSSPGDGQHCPEGCPFTDSGPLTVGADGNLWFQEALFVPGTGEVTVESIGRITPVGDITLFPAPASSSRSPLSTLTVGSDRNLWFPDGNTIVRITSTGEVTVFPAPAGDLRVDTVLTAAPDGNLWFPEANGKIGRITPSGTITEFALADASIRPDVLTVGSDGNLWFSVGQLSPPVTPAIEQIVLDKPPSLTGVVSVTHSRKAITQIILGFDEDLNPASATKGGNYTLAAGVRKKHKLVFSKALKIGGVAYDGTTHHVTITLGKPHMGTTQVTVHGGILASNGLSSKDDFTVVVK